MTAYNTKTFGRFVEAARREGHKRVEVIIAKYEEISLWKDNKYHHNIMLLAGKRKASLYDLTSQKSPDENEQIALKEAADVSARLKINGLEATVQLKPVEYNWWWDKPELD